MPSHLMQTVSLRLPFAPHHCSSNKIAKDSLKKLLELPKVTKELFKMHKDCLWLICIVLAVYFTLIFCNETSSELAKPNAVVNLETETTRETALFSEGRTRKRHGLWYWGWHALAIAYFIKVKVIIVGFFVGTAIFWGLRYYWSHKCPAIHDGPIIYDHPHHTVPYHFDDHFHHDHSYAASDFSPYSAYDGGVISDHPPDSDLSDAAHTHGHGVKRRSLDHRSERRVPLTNEERIGEFMFYFLGLDSKACRRRFVCEMEFRANVHPMTRMAFRVIGGGFFRRYMNTANEQGRASSFDECALVNAECVFIEQGEEQEAESNHDGAASATTVANDEADPSTEAHAHDNEVLGDTFERNNWANLRAERHHQRRKDIVAQRILQQSATQAN